MNKFLLFGMAALIVLAVIGWTTPVSPLLNINGERFINVTEKVGIILMLLNGTFISTRYFKIAIALIGVILVGALMRILHWPGADQTLLIPYLPLFIVYFVHFLGKAPKTYLDISKVLMLIFFLVPTPLWILHVISYDTNAILLNVSHFTFWITFVAFLIVAQRQKLFFE